MMKWVRGLALVTAMAVVSVAALSVAEAQEKGKKSTGKSTGIVEVSEGKDGKYRLIIRDNDEKFLATSAAFATQAEATKGIEKLRDALENPKIVNKKAAAGKGKDKDK
jgi:uncharacterized protein YegP (UPF0339 family)